jgi:HSP20 family protein
MAAKKDVVPKTTPGTLAVRREWEYPFASFQREMNKLFDDFFGGFDLSPWAPLERRLATAFTPHVDVSETDKEIIGFGGTPGHGREGYRRVTH